jgi:hypothetical protein
LTAPGSHTKVCNALREFYFEPPLDEGFREIVITLVANGGETFEVCKG